MPANYFGEHQNSEFLLTLFANWTYFTIPVRDYGIVGEVIIIISVAWGGEAYI